MSPALSVGLQLGFVAVIDTSHDTAPAGSKYFALDRNRRFFCPSRVTVRSSYRPPGWRWPAVPTSVVSCGTTHSCAEPMSRLAVPLAMSGNVYLPLRPVPLFALNTG